MKKQLTCDTCGNIDHVFIDGYSFGDRLLEGVMFIVKPTKDGKANVAFRDPQGQYEQGLTQKKWLKAAKDFAEEHDIAECPHCGDDVDLQEINDTSVKDQPTPIVVQAHKATKILNKRPAKRKPLP